MNERGTKQGEEGAKRRIQWERLCAKEGTTEGRRTKEGEEGEGVDQPDGRRESKDHHFCTVVW